jgi:hypothetical protein
MIPFWSYEAAVCGAPDSFYHAPAVRVGDTRIILRRSFVTVSSGGSMMMSTNVILAAVCVLASPSMGGDREPAAQPPAVKLTVPDTPAGQGLNGFLASFNQGGDKRRAWLKDRTTVDDETAGDILQQDAAVLQEHGAMTLVRLPEASATTIVAIVRHEKTGAHGHLTIDVEPKAPHRVSNMRLRGATPEEIKGL